VGNHPGPPGIMLGFVSFNSLLGGPALHTTRMANLPRVSVGGRELLFEQRRSIAETSIL
jgi:hypothetical protein